MSPPSLVAEPHSAPTLTPVPIPNPNLAPFPNPVPTPPLFSYLAPDPRPGPHPTGPDRPCPTRSTPCHPLRQAVAEEWCSETEKLLAESDNGRQESDDAGPETELEYWRNRMAKFNSITEQLKGRECKVRA